MFQNDVFVFDNVVHMYDLSDDNLVAPTSAVDRAGQLWIGRSVGVSRFDQ